MERKRVSSSNIVSIGYAEDLHVLEVEFKGGAVYQYSSVNPAVHASLMTASSIGGFFAKHIKNSFTFKKV